MARGCLFTFLHIFQKSDSRKEYGCHAGVIRVKKKFSSKKKENRTCPACRQITYRLILYAMSLGNVSLYIYMCVLLSSVDKLKKANATHEMRM